MDRATARRAARVGVRDLAGRAPGPELHGLVAGGRDGGSPVSRSVPTPFDRGGEARGLRFRAPGFSCRFLQSAGPRPCESRPRAPE